MNGKTSADKPRIAVVDDDSSMRQSIVRLLRATGFLPVSFASGESFLQAQATKQSACVVVDLTMPGLSGFEVRLELAKSEPGLPVILLTAHADPALCVIAKRQGFVACLPKPVVPSDLLSAITQALRQTRSFTSSAAP